ncbi:bacterial glycogen synthase [Oceanobacillus iheyensis HTE831]|uniref:Glycogen synthase n=1 Tax=Oceanobacillus iheyensis (strain DSM 14371 / CIP 107618 / JCM 11309 / KCTC 3954 / HTE831) TaxID=221109 RepID=GLGA_OCEIH|nr:glycogen synthase [Oceanobacillus iheyensis]Q8ET54.1 RecName: Full=Glycogen synthase; AltName: Full=Starch [bacterial glycogen] synthase [Oceanobacillus iheyensis HTE831]BAC12365.1 bacterial glycogen synthase [Oceanobacillus iheyensis HTE831]
MKNILFVTSECTPFIKTGGLADVSGSLPQALQEHGGMEVRVMLPLYDEIDRSWKDQFEFVCAFTVSLGWREQTAELYRYRYNDVTYYFIGNDYYFTRKGIYGYYDDGERFVFFSQAIIASLEYIDFIPSVLHAHDWQTGIAVALAKIYQPIEELITVFTIHNIYYQGTMPLTTFDDFFQLGREHLAGMEWNQMINSLKSGIFHADKITTVSPTYAEEILTPYYGAGLEEMLWNRREDLIGVLNGIDLKDYNPAIDKSLPVNYRSARSKKIENRKLLYEEIGLNLKDGVPLYIMVTRLVEQKGIHLVQRILEEFLQEDIQLIVLGNGEQEFEYYFKDIEYRYPDKMITHLHFNESLARRLYASADFLLMPSKFEPCGLSQLIALQYKTVPIVRETGGLKDTIIAFNEITGEGNGFRFANYNAHELLHVLKYSLEIYQQPSLWSVLIKNVNKSKFSWKDSASAYADVYQQLDASSVSYK